mgnify:CR=1 FL=1
MHVLLPPREETMSGAGRYLANRVSKNPRGTQVMDHVVERFWLRWPDSRHLTNEDVRTLIIDQVEEARKAKTITPHPGGARAPIVFMGQEGYAIIREDNNVVTVIRKDSV